LRLTTGSPSSSGRSSRKRSMSGTGTRRTLPRSPGSRGVWLA
jgi:hypothetical protein